jgi:F1F0 ATPase subunit 2
MNEALSVLTGLLLGMVFFGGLWWTVRLGLPSGYAALWFSGSFLLRAAIVVAGFLYTARGDWRRVAGCGAGFLAARLMVVRLTRLKEAA